MRTPRFASASAVLFTLSLGGLSRDAFAQGRPTIDHIEPASGPPGTHVNIVGLNFRPSARVRFGGVDVMVGERSPERLSVDVPAGAHTGPFTVRIGGDEIDSENFTVTAAAPPPVIRAIEPASAQPGAEVVIRGEHFGASPAANTVRTGMLPVTVRAADETTLRVVIPEGAVTGPLVVRTSSGEATSPVPLTVTARVTVREFNPSGAAPGARVTLRGQGFGNGTPAPRVTLGGRVVHVVSVAPNELVFEVPRDAQRGGTILVEVPGNGRFETGAQLRVAPAPAITSVEPAQGAPGSTVTLRGERFGTDAGAVHASLGGTATRVVSVAPNAIVAEVPADAGGSRWAVTVNGIGPVEATSDYRLMEPVRVAVFAPAAGDVGDRIVIRGGGFSPTPNENTVRLNGLAATVVTATANEMLVEIPAGAHSGQITVAVAGNGEAHSREPFMVTARPHIDTLDPPRGIAGSTVVLRGRNLPAAISLAQVRLGTHDCAVTSASHEGLTVTLPDDVQPGPARFTVIGRLQGTGTSESEFQVLVPSRITGVEPARAPVGAHVTVTGVGFESDPRALVVHVGGRVVRPVSASTTAIDFVVPRGADASGVVVESALRQTATASFAVTVPPVITGFAPASVARGGQLTIRGRNFGTDAGAVSVLVGDAPCGVTRVSDTSIAATVPSAASSGRIVVRVRDQGEAGAARDVTVR